MSLMCPCSSLFLVGAWKKTAVIITSTIIMEYTLQASSTDCSEALVEVFYCHLPRKPPVSLLIISFCENVFLLRSLRLCEKSNFYNPHFLAATLGSRLKFLLSQVLVTRPAMYDEKRKHLASSIQHLVSSILDFVSCISQGFWHQSRKNEHTCHSPLWHQGKGRPPGGTSLMKGLVKRCPCHSPKDLHYSLTTTSLTHSSY